MGKPIILGVNWITVGFADPMFPIQYATFMELRLQQMGDFYEKPHFTMENFKYWEPVLWGLKIILLNYQKAHPYAKSGRTNRLAYVAVALVWRYTTARKKVRENRHWKVDVVYNTTPLPRRRDIGWSRRFSNRVGHFDRKFKVERGRRPQLLLVSEN